MAEQHFHVQVCVASRRAYLRKCFALPLPGMMMVNNCCRIPHRQRCHYVIGAHPPILKRRVQSESTLRTRRRSRSAIRHPNLVWGRRHRRSSGSRLISYNRDTVRATRVDKATLMSIYCDLVGWLEQLSNANTVVAGKLRRNPETSQ